MNKADWQERVLPHGPLVALGPGLWQVTGRVLPGAIPPRSVGSDLSRHAPRAARHRFHSAAPGGFPSCEMLGLRRQLFRAAL